jgi:glycine cleavage system regulatory protein
MAGDLPVWVVVLRLCRERGPRLSWDTARVVRVCEDFADVDVVAVAQRALDYIETRPGTKDGPRTLRTFMERARAEKDRRHQAAAELQVYDRTRN